VHPSPVAEVVLNDDALTRFYDVVECEVPVADTVRGLRTVIADAYSVRIADHRAQWRGVGCAERDEL
jgi:hypothetical protein